MQQELDAKGPPPHGDARTIEVDCDAPSTSQGMGAWPLARTIARHGNGISGREIGRLRGAVRFMELQCSPRRGVGLWVAHTSKGAGRSIIADVQERITKQQGKLRLVRYSVTVLEPDDTDTGVHGHIVFVGNVEIARHLEASSALGGLQVDPVNEVRGLVDGYLVKTRTAESNYKGQHALGGRIRGSHRLEGGGDRVRLSRELERDSVEGGHVRPWQHSNARRSADRKPYRPRRLRKTALRPAGQIQLFPELDRPIARLHQFARGYMPKVVAIETEFRRRRLGLSQRAVAARIGISQGQYANAIRGRDPTSRAATSRLRAVLLQHEAAA